MGGALRCAPSKVPDHRGLALTSAITVEIDEDGLELSRTGTGLSMKIQAKDCAQGGIFQMEPQRGDGTAHPHHAHARDLGTRADAVLLRQPELPGPASASSSASTAPASRPARPASSASRWRPASTSATTCLAQVRGPRQRPGRHPRPAARRATPPPRSTPSVRHCGGVSVWDVASGGRMGFVTGEDATEVANPPTNCTQNCQAQNQVRGRLAEPRLPVPGPGRQPPDAPRLGPASAGADRTLSQPVPIAARPERGVHRTPRSAVLHRDRR